MIAFSLRSRIVAMFVLLYGAMFILLLGWTVVHVKEDYRKEVDHDLRRQMDEIAVIVGRGRDTVNVFGHLLASTSSMMTLANHVSILRGDSVLYQCRDFPGGGRARATEDDFRTVRTGADWYRLYTRTLDGYTVTVAERITAAEHTLEESIVFVLVSIPVVIIISLISGYYLVRRLLRPLNDIMTRARSITSSNLNERLPRPGSKDEVDRLAETLNDMIERLERSFSQLEQFSANAAHELRTPLTILRGELQMALDVDRDATEYRRVLESNYEEVKRITRTVENLFMLSRIDNHQVSMESEEVELRTLLEEIVRVGELLGAPRSIGITLSCAGTYHVRGDAVMLMQLFLNLVDNAIKYNRDGGRVHISLRDDERAVHVDIADTGIGISAADQARVFDRFVRVDRHATRLRHGAGLGLSLAQWIATMHGGEIRLRSTVGEGSVFTVILPTMPCSN